MVYRAQHKRATCYTYEIIAPTRRADLTKAVYEFGK